MATVGPALVLAVGQSERIALPGRGAGGFGWQASVAGPDGIVRLHWSAGARPALPPAGGLPPVSYSLDQILTVDALAAGQVSLDCRLVRGSEPPVDRRHFTIEVVPAADR